MGKTTHAARTSRYIELDTYLTRLAKLLNDSIIACEYYYYISNKLIKDIYLKVFFKNQVKSKRADDFFKKKTGTKNKF